MRSKLVYLTFAVLLGVLLIFGWFRFVDFEDVVDQLLRADIGKLLWAAALYMAAYFIRSVRFNLLLRANVVCSYTRTWMYCLASNMINYLIPIRIGELAKAWFLKRNHKEPITRSLPTIFIDKSFDTIGILVILIIIPFVSIRLSPAIYTMLAIMFFVFFVSLLIIIMSSRHSGLVERLLHTLFFFLPRRIQNKIREYITLFVQGLNLFEHRWSYLFYAVFLTITGIMFDALYFYMVFRALGVSFSFFMIMFGYTLINLSYALPQPPAQIGTNEWMMLLVFSTGFGLTRNTAAAIMALAHVSTAAIVLISGSIAIAYSGFDILKNVFKADPNGDLPTPSGNG